MSTATTFERLDREILALRKAAAVGQTVAWNLEGRLVRPVRTPSIWAQGVRGLATCELVAAVAAVIVALSVGGAL